MMGYIFIKVTQSATLQKHIMSNKSQLIDICSKGETQNQH